MAIIQRGTKSVGGGTDFAGGSILKAEVNTDINTIYNDYNGNITNANMAAAADIAPSKLGDASVDDTAHAATTTPGDSSGHTNPTTLTGEIQQIRHILEMHGLGVDADRVDGAGTGTTFWADRPARMVNLLKNPSFLGGAAATTTPAVGWADLGTGTPTFSNQALAGANLTEGKGAAHRVTAGSAAVAGWTQTVHLKASTRYLVVARARAVTNAVHLKTTGADAASSFRNIDDSSTSTSFVTLKGVIQTDSTPTNVVVQITTNGASADAVEATFCGLYECSADLTQIGPTPWIVDSDTASVTVTGTFTAIPNLSVQTYSNDGCQIEVELSLPVRRNSSNGTIGVKLMENVAGGGAAEVFYEEYGVNSSCEPVNAKIFFVRESPTPGSSYVYTVQVATDAANVAVIPGTNVIGTGGTKRYYLRCRSVRVSQ